MMTLDDDHHAAFLSGYLSGVLAGIDLGREQMDAELSAIQRNAHIVVQAMAKLSPWEEAQQTIRRRQDEAAKRNRAAGQPWPFEVAS